MGEIDGVFIEQGFVPKVLILSESKTLKAKVDSIVKTIDKKIGCSFVRRGDLSHISSELLLPLHDPKNIFQELKGDSKKNERR